jgi:glycosyltransferase involved in cell wall biosynthesis
MKKIMYILNYPGDGGTEKYVLNLISALGKDRCVFVYSENGPFLDKFKELGLPSYQVTMNGPFDLKAALKIKKICQQEGVHYIHAQFLRENYIALLATLLGAKVKVVWTYHVNVPMPALFKVLNRSMIKLNHRVISVANFIKMELLKKGIPEDKITVIYNGISEPKVDNSKRVYSNEKMILAKLKNNHPHLKWRLNIVGDGPLKEDLKLLAAKLNLLSNINFQGFVNNMDTVYINSDLIVLPSENEAFPFVAIEALAYEKPVISTNVGGLPEIIRHNETGLLVPYGDENAMADSILRVLEDEEFGKRIANSGKDFFLKNLTFDKMLNQTLAIYNLENEDNK